MVEEFHAVRNAENIVTASKQLYGWGTLNVNAWLPSLSELVGATGTQNAGNGCYYSVMQGIGTSDQAYWVDANGGTQFTYFAQYNTSGGGDCVWQTCNKQRSWLRSSGCGYSDDAWRVDGTFVTNGAPKVTSTAAVHPAVNTVLYAIKVVSRLIAV